MMLMLLFGLLFGVLIFFVSWLNRLVWKNRSRHDPPKFTRMGDGTVNRE